MAWRGFITSEVTITTLHNGCTQNKLAKTSPSFCIHVFSYKTSPERKPSRIWLSSSSQRWAERTAPIPNSWFTSLSPSNGECVADSRVAATHRVEVICVWSFLHQPHRLMFNGLGPADSARLSQHRGARERQWVKKSMYIDEYDEYPVVGWGQVQRQAHLF